MTVFELIYFGSSENPLWLQASDKEKLLKEKEAELNELRHNLDAEKEKFQNENRRSQNFEDSLSKIATDHGGLHEELIKQVRNWEELVMVIVMDLIMVMDYVCMYMTLQS